jgi:rhodanese-related sulfurtransferase
MAAGPSPATGRVWHVTLGELLETARSRLVRLSALQLCEAMGRDTRLVVLDTRTPTDRATYGCIPGSLHTPRTVLEWRVALDAPLRLREITSHDQLLVVVCNEGFSSSLAAVSLQSLGFHRATDLIGGVMAWRDAGLPMVEPANDEVGIQLDETQAATNATIDQGVRQRSFLRESNWSASVGPHVPEG